MEFEKLDFKDVTVMQVFSKKKKPSSKSNIKYDQMQKELVVTKWQKSAVRAAIKAALIEKKIMKLLSDPKLTNKALSKVLKDCANSEALQSFLANKESKE